MNILHIIPSVDPRGGGPTECMVRIAGEHASSGITSEALSFDEPDAPYLGGLPLCVHGLGKGITPFSYHRGLVPWLIDNVDRFDAVIIHGIWQYHSVGAWRVLRKSKVPYFVYTHGMLDPWFKHQYPLKHLKKWLFWPWADYRVLRDARAVLFTCEEERLLAAQSFWLYKANEVVVKFGSATPPQDGGRLKELFLSAYPDLQGKRLFLFLGRIHKKKGCDLLIEAFAKVARQEVSVRLVMAGPDQSGWASELKVLANHLGIGDRIYWTGMLSGDLKWGAFYASELFVLPSHQENFGIAVAESLGCGVPVLISTKVNIWREICADGAGFVGEDNAIDTEKNLQRWLTLDVSQRDAMRVQARHSFQSRFTVQEMAESLTQAIQC
jgi:glycosyltransferase involved in cell wall biosynthesis